MTGHHTAERGAGSTAGLMPGFGNHFSTEAVTGALPIGRNSPQKAPFGLYAEQLSGSAFTAPRSENRRSWLYRLRPSAAQGPFHRYQGAKLWQSAPLDPEWASPNRLRWNPISYPDAPADFVDAMLTYGGNGDVSTGVGVGIHGYVATESMTRRAFLNADGEMLIVPQEGILRIVTELGVMDVAPLQIAMIPRGVRFCVTLPDGRARGYVCENYGAPFRLPELGPIGSNGLANVRDFETPSAWFEDVDETTELIQKFQGQFWTTLLDHSPFDVAAWHGNLAPCRYDLRRYNAVGTVSFDHPDPSIYTVLTSPSETPGTANCDFVIFPPRWMVAEDSFRPPWYHRNVMSEFMGLISGQYDAKESGFVPGGASLHNQMNGHGPDRTSYEKAIAEDLVPYRIENSMAFMFESRWVVRTTRWAAETPLGQPDYDSVWEGFVKAKLPR